MKENNRPQPFEGRFRVMQRYKMGSVSRWGRARSASGFYYRVSVASGLSQIISRLAPSLPITDHPNKA